MPPESTKVLISNYKKALAVLETRLTRQQEAVAATEGQIQGFKDLIAQMEAKK